MDSGKLKKLKEVDWMPVSCCGTCIFGAFQGAQQWGLCSNESNQYQHNKHDRTHELPAHRGAVCDKFEANDVHEELVNFLNSPVTS